MKVVPAAARTWARLQQPVVLPFPNQAPLEDVLRYVAASQTSEEDPLRIYVKPLSLDLAEKRPPR